MGTLLKFFLLVVFPSVTGAGSYLICREIKRPLESFIQFMALGSILLIPLLALVLMEGTTTLDFAFTTVTVSGGGFLLFLVLFIGSLWFLGGHADAKAMGRVEPDWFSNHFLIYSATLSSLIVGALNGSVFGKILGITFPYLHQPSSWMLYLLLLLTFPSLTPILILAKQRVELLPGFRKLVSNRS